MATSLPGVKLVAACDCYDGRLQHMKEVYGAETFTTRDYREIVAPQRHRCGDYCDARPLARSHFCRLSERGQTCLLRKADGARDRRRPIDHRCAGEDPAKCFKSAANTAVRWPIRRHRELFQSKAIGELNSVEAWLDRNTRHRRLGIFDSSRCQPGKLAIGSASREMRRSVPGIAKRFFRWRNYRDYGTGVAGDLFVHLLTGLHTVTSSIGPTRIYATGGIRFWKDREVPDVMLATLDYPATDAHPAFNVLLHVNFKSSLPKSRLE